VQSNKEFLSIIMAISRHFSVTSDTVLVTTTLLLSLLLFSPNHHFYCIQQVQALSIMMAASSSAKKVVVVGGGIQGTSVAYHLAQRGAQVTLLEAKAPASAASVKGGGFMARSWGDGGPTQQLHELAFDLYEEYAPALGCTTYRKLPVLSVSAGYQKGIRQAQKQYGDIMPSWLDGEEYGRISPMGYGDDTAQITPDEFVTKMLEAQKQNIDIVLGSCTGMETDHQGSERGTRKIVGVKYQPRGDDTTNEQVLAADAVVISAGPWSCAAEDWFQGAVQLPMEGVKSTSIVWKKPEGKDIDATALFCGEDDRFGTHCELSTLFLY